MRQKGLSKSMNISRMQIRTLSLDPVVRSVSQSTVLHILPHVLLLVCDVLQPSRMDRREINTDRSCSRTQNPSRVPTDTSLTRVYGNQDRGRRQLLTLSETHGSGDVTQTRTRMCRAEGRQSPAFWKKGNRFRRIATQCLLGQV
jgi:hypothetical protein